MRFSIIVVALNPGAKLRLTLDSILCQTFGDYEIILKDGGSTDGSVDFLKNGAETVYGSEKSGRIRFFDEPDKSIYDAMNQAVSHAQGEFVLFLNCGDLFAGDRVLEQTDEQIRKQVQNGADVERLVLYGDTLSEKNQVVIASPPEMNGFTCYRNIPCHQACFYSRSLCREKPYETSYRIRADYDHFLWCFYEAGAKMVHMGFAVASYEGGGYSESRENRKRDKEEHRLITETYMTRGELFRYRAIMACTLAPLRRAMAESKVFSGLYHCLKERIYKKK